MWTDTPGSASIEIGDTWSSWYRMYLYFINGIYEKYTLYI